MLHSLPGPAIFIRHRSPFAKLLCRQTKACTAHKTPLFFQDYPKILENFDDSND